MLVWHGEFEKNKATEDELKIAKYSKTNMITPSDHEPEEILVKDKDAPHGYRTRTQDELEEVAIRKVEANKRNAKTHQTLASLFALAGMDLDKYFASSKKPKKKDHKDTIRLKMAKYKRELKVAKRNKDLEKVKVLKDCINNLKLKI